MFGKIKDIVKVRPCYSFKIAALVFVDQNTLRQGVERHIAIYCHGVKIDSLAILLIGNRPIVVVKSFAKFRRLAEQSVKLGNAVIIFRLLKVGHIISKPRNTESSHYNSGFASDERLRCFALPRQVRSC